MSAPIVVYGHCVLRSGEMLGSGSKLKSKGCAPVSEVRMFRLSISSLVVGLIYPAVDNAGCSPVAQVSRIMSCADFLLMRLHLNVWSPHLSCICEQMQVSVFCSVWTGSRSFRRMAIVNIQFGRRWSGLLLFIPVSGYDMCGDSMLGRRCVCSGASMFIIE